MSFDGLVPERCDGDAHQNGANEGPASVDDENADHDSAEEFYFFGGKDTHVLEDYGNLCQNEREVIHRNRYPETLELSLAATRDVKVCGNLLERTLEDHLVG